MKEFFISTLIFLLGGITIFPLSNIIYPIFYALPKIRRLQKEGKMEKVPFIFTIRPVLLNSALLLLLFWIVNRFIPTHFDLFCVITLAVLIITIYQIPKKNKDLEWDFENSYGKFFKK